MAGPADFSVRSTDIGETQNFLTPQQGVRNDSMAAIIGGVGEAAMMGMETYATVKSQQFAKDYEAVTQLGLGAEATTEEEKQFQDRMNRISQAAQMGKTETAKVLREEFLRKSIADKPWLSKRYEEMAGRIDGRYTDLVSALEKSEAAAAAQLSATEKARLDMRKSIITRVQRVAEPLGYVPTDMDGKPKAWELMTDNELLWNENKVQIMNHRMRLVEAGRKDEEMGMTRTRFQQGNISFGDSQYSTAQARKADRGKELAEVATAYASAEGSRRMNEWVLNNPGASKEQMAAAGRDIAMQLGQSVRRDLSVQAGQKGISISPTDIDNYVALVESQANFYVDQVTGPTSQGSVVARKYKEMEDQGGITSWIYLPIQNTMSKAGIPFEPVTLANLNAILGENPESSIRSMTDLKTVLETLVNNPESAYTPTGTPVDIAAQAISTNALVDSYRSGSPAYNALLENPQAFVPFILPGAAAWAAEPNETKKALILDALTNPIIMESLNKAHPAHQQQVYDVLKPLISSAIQRVSSLDKGPEYVQSFDPKTGMFTAIPGNNLSKQYVDIANKMYRKASMLEMQFNSDADPDRILRNYFGPKMADKFMATPVQEAAQ